MKNQNLTANNFFIGWKEYNSIKKKAIDSGLSGKRGLIVSLSIAFFIVMAVAQLLRTTYELYK